MTGSFVQSFDAALVSRTGFPCRLELYKFSGANPTSPGGRVRPVKLWLISIL